MKKTKVLVMVPYLKGTGGTETVIKNLNTSYLQSSNREAYELKLISFGGTKEKHWLANWNKVIYSFSDIRLFQMMLYVLAMPWLCLKTILAEKPDVVICTNPFIWQIAYFFRELTHVNFKIYAWYHYSIMQKHLKHAALQRCDHFLAISHGIARQLMNLGVDEDKITVLTNPVVICSNVKLVRRSERDGNRNHKTRFLYIGRIDFDGQKNVQELFNALAYVHGVWKLDLFGTCSKKDKEALMKIAKKNGFADNVVFRGYTSNVWERIHNADALILTSKFEGFPMILCEAISHGIFAVSSDCETGPSDIIQRENGLLYKPGDVPELAKILTDITLQKLCLPSEAAIVQTITKFNLENFIRAFERSVVFRSNREFNF